MPALRFGENSSAILRMPNDRERVFHPGGGRRRYKNRGASVRLANLYVAAR
jgi:hypothetical protein